MPLWQVVILLNTETVGEFCYLYNKGQYLHIRGKMLNGKWVVTIKATIKGHEAWGVNNLLTDMEGHPRDVIKYFVNKLLIQVCSCEGVSKDELLKELKSYGN